ncbi:hypothetical protein [Tuwongella immobilis]|uniref:Glycosyltransferase RgtA/B/C/D-like domain-containing protein n=1 Tax=Tuwongella immobilis TaxID=692036 RepID=A0A6C2YNF7_9BACT|nr:hypothetical protein [Tuwongella immobilis]VIP02663.1 Uncharacterized protein OS=Planctomyces maris DSM 8797 GN=PM8797T_32020 PE=4 SV=1 [Tuwongella immobilis]VTS02078.1 Uncharacterized protein OS=Planctomyces maris DSM 8797 GN=PM8797T_32020 PE=4 SV=1 [Tuwongella immobilis]
MHSILPRLVEWLGWLLLFGLLLLGVPPFLHMPIWVDATLYDTAAWNMWLGGVHYRDVFDTNLPGMPWAHLAVRVVLGWSSMSLRAVDLAVFAGSTLVMVDLLRRCQISRSGQVWAAVGWIGFYVYLSEFCQTQRDTWMILPALLAVRRRFDRLVSASDDPPRDWIFRLTVLEGAIWAVAFWVKPHIAFPVIGVWLASIPQIRQFGSGAIIRDFLGLILGGLCMGILGMIWIVMTGTLEPMREVFLEWNPGYLEWTWLEMLHRYCSFWMNFPVWSLVHGLAIPVAVISLAARRTTPEMLAVRMLAGLYLGWLFQSLIFQRSLQYVHVPGVLLGIAVLASRAIPAGGILLGWCGLTAGLCLIRPHYSCVQSAMEAYSHHFPRTYEATIAEPGYSVRNRIRFWPECWTFETDPYRKIQLSHLYGIYPSSEPFLLERVANYLEKQSLQPGDLLCWNEGTHPLYLRLQHVPTFRFMHVGTALGFKHKRAQIHQELLRIRPKFVVTDWYAYPDVDVEALPNGEVGGSLPKSFPKPACDQFPWNQPIRYRSGRYVVHEIQYPLGDVDLKSPMSD